MAYPPLLTGECREFERRFKESFSPGMSFRKAGISLCVVTALLLFAQIVLSPQRKGNRGVKCRDQDQGRGLFEAESVTESPPSIKELDNITPAIYTHAGKRITVWPISFSAPENIWVPVVQVKSADFAQIIPGNLSTYVYTEELEYYEGYRYDVFCDGSLFLPI